MQRKKMKKFSVLLTVCFLAALASSVRAQTSGPNNAELNGNYVFTFDGFTGSSSASSVFSAVGRFTADGAGSLTNGELDSNGVNGGDVRTAQPFTGTYAIGSDNRGVMTLNIGGITFTPAFATATNRESVRIQILATWRK